MCDEQRLEIERLRRELAEAQEAAKADRLVVEEAYCNEKAAKAQLAEARGLLERVASNIRWDALPEKPVEGDRVDAMCRDIRTFLTGDQSPG